MSRPMTLRQAVEQHAAEDAAFDAKHPDVAPVAIPQPTDPRIGVLMRQGCPVLYATVAGVTRFGTEAELVAALNRTRREAKFDWRNRDFDDESEGWAEHVAAQAEYEQDCREGR